MELIQRIITEVNQKTGEAECQFYKRGLSYPEEGQRVPEIHASRFLYCHGELKSTKGQVKKVVSYFLSFITSLHSTVLRHRIFLLCILIFHLFSFLSFITAFAEAACVLVRAGAGFDTASGARQRRPGAIPGLPSTLTCSPDPAGRPAWWRDQQFWILPWCLHWQRQR